MEPMLPYDLEALRTSERHEGKDACKAGMHTTDPITPTSPDYHKAPHEPSNTTRITP